MPTVLSKLASLLTPAAVALARIFLNESLNEIEQLVQSLIRKAAQRLVQAQEA